LDLSVNSNFLPCILSFWCSFWCNRIHILFNLGFALCSLVPCY
jgi:hypothetical protein